MAMALGLRTEASSAAREGAAARARRLGAARAAHLLEQAGATVRMPPFASGRRSGAGRTDPPVPVDVRRLLGLRAGRSRRSVGPCDLLGFDVRERRRRAMLEVTVAALARRRHDPRRRHRRGRAHRRLRSHRSRAAADRRAGVYRACSTSDERRIAHALAALGYREAVTFALQPARSRAMATRRRACRCRDPPSRSSTRSRKTSASCVSRCCPDPRNWPRATAAPPRSASSRSVTCSRAAPSRSKRPAPCGCSRSRRRTSPAGATAASSAFKGESQALLRSLTGATRSRCERPACLCTPARRPSCWSTDATSCTIGAVDPRLLAAYDVERGLRRRLLRFADLPAYRMPRYRAAVALSGDRARSGADRSRPTCPRPTSRLACARRRRRRCAACAFSTSTADRRWGSTRRASRCASCCNATTRP